jgi:NADH-quinone oxidoreductase subunit G
MDMGVAPELLPGYQPSTQAGMSLPEMLGAEDLGVLWSIGADPLAESALAAGSAFIIVQDLFLTETARKADVVFPSASLYEKSGTVTNVCGEVQKLKRAAQTMGAKADLEIIGLLAKELGAAATMGPWVADKVTAQVTQTVRGYNIPLPVIATGGAAQTLPLDGRIAVETNPALIRSAEDTLFTSGTLGRYSKKLNSLMEAPGKLYEEGSVLELTHS